MWTPFCHWYQWIDRGGQAWVEDAALFLMIFQYVLYSWLCARYQESSTVKNTGVGAQCWSVLLA